MASLDTGLSIAFVGRSRSQLAAATCHPKYFRRDYQTLLPETVAMETFEDVTAKAGYPGTHIGRGMERRF